MHPYNGAAAVAGCTMGCFYTAELQSDADKKEV
jgi:hypothetical protein